VCGGRVQLLRGIYPGKDQSYFLHRLSQAQLTRTLFPVGHLPKSEVRAIARRIGLPNAAKRDSTGICFIGERPFREFLNRYLPTRPGPIRTSEDRVVGEHVGLSFYTLGQRKGIGVGGMREGSGAAWFVARKDMASNTLWIVQGHDHPWLRSLRLEADDASWIDGAPPPPASPGRPRRPGRQFGAKTRYRQDDAPCQFAPRGDAAFSLSFEEPQWAATPGQSAVLYEGEVCLGGGVILSTQMAALGAPVP
jgi:tRNA-specific 2-thiouridylase